jgi:hypothetical protein
VGSGGGGWGRLFSGSMKTLACVVAAVVAGCGVGALGQQGPREEGWERMVREVASARTNVEVREIGRSAGGRPLLAARVSGRGELPPEELPAVVVVAGLDARHRIGTEVAMHLVDRLSADRGGALGEMVLYVLPCMNPDTMAWHAREGAARVDFGGVIREQDWDRDGRVNEDPAEDLNGDGIISMMRVRHPAPGSGLSVEWMIDPENPKLMKKPDAAKGERAEYALVVEGIDNDGDGRLNEDGIGGAGGGVDLNRNFPYRWPEFEDGAGPHQLSEPESLALARFILDTPNIAAVVVYGPGDTLVNIPEAGKFDATNRVPLGIENGDKPLWEEVGKLYREATRINEAPSADLAGSFVGWCYGTLGIPAFQSHVWVRPDQLKTEEKKEEPQKKEEKAEGEEQEGVDVEAMIERFRGASPDERRAMMAEAESLPDEARARLRDAMRGRGAAVPGGARPQRSSGGGDGKRPSGEEAKWLKWAEERREASDMPRFVDWEEFDHPQLGRVEIGGFVPGAKLTPPPGELDRLAGEQAEFVRMLASRLARVRVEELRVRELGPGVYRIWARVVNGGAMATVTAMRAKSQHGLPTIVEIMVPVERIVSGQKFTRRWEIPAGGVFDVEWVITGEPGARVEIVLSPTVGPRVVYGTTLEEAR